MTHRVRPLDAPLFAPLVAPLFAIASGKGGVGKTWLAITLAHAWARDGVRVLLCDGDFGLANIDVQLGISPAGDLGGVIAGRTDMAAAISPHPAGFSVVPGCSGSGSLSALPPDALERVLATLRGAGTGYDRVVLDLGAGLDRNLRRMAVEADTLLVVATDEPTSLTDAYAVLKLYAADRRGMPGAGSAQIVINQAASIPAGRRTYEAIARACTAFLGATPGLAGIIRRDDQVRVAIRRQTPLLHVAPHCPAAQDVAALARAL